MAALDKQPVTGAGPLNGLLTWVDARFPLIKLWEDQWGKYVAPKNFNFWYYFGSLSAFVLVLQIVTGIFLTMNYKQDAAQAFASVEYIMRDVWGGWIIRYMHSTGASAFFICMHAHAGFLAHGEIHIEYADGCVVEHKAPQIVAIDPGHDGWVVGKEPVVIIEFDFESDTVQRLGMPETHQH